MGTIFRQVAISLLLVLASLIPLALSATEAEGYSNQYLFDEAVDIFFDTNPRYDSLDQTKTRNVYRIRDLVGDEQNMAENAHRITISLIKEDGADVEAYVYEPNGRPIAYLFSSGERSEVDFYIPYDGDYFMEVKTLPEQNSADYRYEMGGIQNSNNNLFDGNNKPGPSGFSGSKELGGGLHPTHDIVDYIQFDLQPETAIEVTWFTVAPFKFDVLDENEDLLYELDLDDSYEFKNDGATEIRFIFRVYYPLDGNTLYLPNDRSYQVNAFVWSHTTLPSINQSALWPNTFQINEDTPLYPSLNLSSHFIEENGDPLDFEITSQNDGVSVMFRNITFGSGQSKYNITYVDVEPNENWHGTEVVSFKASDRDGSVTDSFNLEVREVNDLPQILKIGGADYEGGVFNMYGIEDEVLVYKMAYDDADDPIENLFFTTNATSGSMPFVKVFTNGTTVISPSQEHVGQYFFNITLEDGRGGYTIVDINMAIEPVNDPPLVPEIEILKGNLTLLPGEEITLRAVNVFDPDNEDLTITWKWGDGKTCQGIQASHIYSTSYSGNTTINVTVSDGSLSGSNTLRIFVEAPEDVARGDLIREVADRKGDAVKAQEEWRITGEGDRVFRVSTISEPGLDIVSIRSQRRGSMLQVLLDIQDTIQIDGTFRYDLFIMKSGYSEPDLDFRNLSQWDSIPLRQPDQSMVISHRRYSGDPALFENSTGTIINKATLVWTFSFNELVENGLTFPIDPEDFEFYAVVSHQIDYRETGNLAERYIITDTAGEGSLIIDRISPNDNSSGGSGSTFGDFAKPTNIIAVIGIVVFLIVLVVAATILVRKQIKEKKQNEQEFLDHIEKMKSEGKDPFGKELKEKEDTEKTSYKEVYGGPSPKGHKEGSSYVPPSTLPGPGLGKPIDSGSHIEELEIDRK